MKCLNRYDVIIVTYNRLELLKECIEHVKQQCVKAEHIIIVNNASTDGTTEYLDEIKYETNIIVMNLTKNIGGSGGFSKGVEKSLEFESEWILLIDDDAMLRDDYWEKILTGIARYPNTKALSGTVYVKGTIDVGHRSRLIRYRKGLIKRKKYSVSELKDYDKDFFAIENATFCGLVIRKELVEKIGLPRGDYFIWNDDMEYCLRIGKHSSIINVSKAGLDHKTNLLAGNTSVGGVKYVWKEYYRIRNRIDIAKEYDGPLEVGRMCLALCIRAINCGKRMKQDTENSADWAYNKRMIFDAIKDGLLGHMGRNPLY